MAENYDDRVLHFCDSCTLVDRAPRHIQWVVEGNGVSDEDKILRAMANAKTPEETLAVVSALRDEAKIEKHIDCCAADGCALCAEVLEKNGDKRNEELAKALAPKEN